MSKTQVSFEEVIAIRERLREINTIPFDDIEWTQDGCTVIVTSEAADNWRFIGLSNVSFVETYGQLMPHESVA